MNIDGFVFSANEIEIMVYNKLLHIKADERKCFVISMIDNLEFILDDKVIEMEPMILPKDIDYGNQEYDYRTNQEVEEQTKQELNVYKNFLNHLKNHT
jgi:hypothetical protein